MCGVPKQIRTNKNTSAGMKMTEMEPLCSLDGGDVNHDNSFRPYRPVWPLSTHSVLGKTLIP